MATINEILPRFCTELQDLLASVGRGDLADQVPILPIVSRCTCGESNCAHFYTAVRPSGAYGAGHANLLLPADSGLVVLDLVDNNIVAVEVLDRPDVKTPLDDRLPVPQASRSCSLACPACGFLTVPESTYGTYNICDLCGWEDDPVQLANPACRGGANAESLAEAQAAALARFPEAISEAQGIDRSASWRPLRTDELAIASAERDERPWKNQAITTPHDSYWMKHHA